MASDGRYGVVEAKRRGPTRRTVLASASALAGAWLLGGAADSAARDLDRAALDPRRAHCDVLFIGAHPDDESSNLGTFGRWREELGLRTGVLTITRGEGGGNAVGLAEGPELGLIREDEERRATALAGIENIFYLDKPDFWYTLSAPLTARIWGAADTLARVVRLVRATTPHTIVVMDPRPFNQHGGHQFSARLGIEAFRLAGDPHAFPEQLTVEGLALWRPRRLLAQNYGFSELLGPDAAERQRTDPASGLPVLGVWSGARSREYGTTWAQVQRDAARLYRTQGFAAMPAQVPTDPRQLGSDWFTVLAEDGRFIEAPVRRQDGLKPLYAEFRDWAERNGLPWLANRAQPDYPPRPATTVPAVATAPVLNGVPDPGEYPGPELPLAVWQGDDRCTATAKLARHADDLYVLVTVRDRAKGAALARDDVKRHWRTDSVEIAIDPRGDSDDTATTLKTGILPYTADGGPAAERDADNNQGPVGDSGIQVAAKVTEPYTGYTVEVKIPFAALPAPVDPARFAMNIMVYNSDTTDKTGQTRLAWSPFGSPQADPYVWGTATLVDYQPPDTPKDAAPPSIPRTAARSADSPASRAQAARIGVPIAGDPIG
ncbi:MULTISPECIES: sugar-binding protein [unclassified Nocardia]|uniref:sugar-binding protein n=1 Tax=unclassified Nocardia TaxID=2637762 RepID=UPI001CE41E4E|nr:MULTISPECIES: sugar-binding protein [unclassified Nocardia]